MKDLKKISAACFARILKRDHDQGDNRFVLFLGAGCSVSSGIKSAGELVRERWIPELIYQETGNHHKSADGWARKKFPKYDPKNPALSYGEVMEELFPAPHQRQRAVEDICNGVFPGFGYAVLAALVANTGGTFSNILTTNFDDLLGDAFYLFTEAKPLIIQHESLANFITTSRNRPLVVKVHGDSCISPYNTKEEIDKLKDNIQKPLRDLITGKGLIFIGYGGNDPGIVKMLEGLPEEAKNHGVYWVSRSEPQGAIRPWLEARNAIRVEINDFDGFMLFIRNEFDLAMPDSKRFDHVIENLDDTSEGVKELKEAVEKTGQSFSGWYAVELEALKYKKNDPDRADKIYREGLEQFPSSDPLLGNYAVFLHYKDNDRAEEYYQRALKADPNDADHLGNYAIFLQGIRKDNDRAEEYYQRALKADPNHANILGNYATFLEDICKDYDKAEEYYLRALKADPNDADHLGNYALFLQDIRKDNDRAEEYYQRALKADPNNANNLDNYATFLKDIRKDYDKAEEYYQRALKADPNNANNLGNYAGFLLGMGKKNEGLTCLGHAMAYPELKEKQFLEAECLFYGYANGSLTERKKYLQDLKALLKEGASSPDWDFSLNIQEAQKEGHPEAKWLQPLADVISGKTDIKTLSSWPAWKDA